MAGAKYKKPCFDSSVFLAGLNQEICNGIKRHVVFDYIWEKAKASEYKMFISAIAIAEVHRRRRKNNTESVLLDEFLERINEPFVEVIEVDREIGLKAHEYCRTYAANKLYPMDAVHLACAVRAECDVLLTWDTPLIGVSHPRIRIEEPRIIGDLFAPDPIATQEEIDAYEKERQSSSTKPEVTIASVGQLLALLLSQKPENQPGPPTRAAEKPN